MAIMEYHQGCPAGGKVSECWGPVGNYYTLFGSELRNLTGHLVISIVLGLILFGTLLFLKKGKKINLPVYMIIIMPKLLMQKTTYFNMWMNAILDIQKFQTNHIL